MSLTLYKWLQIGMAKGFCSEPVCATHDGLPAFDAAEEAEWDRGGDPCALAVRVWPVGSRPDTSVGSTDVDIED